MHMSGAWRTEAVKTRIRSVRLKIRYKRRSDLAALILLTLALATVACLGALAWGRKEAAASAPAAPAAYAPRRKYYLTQSPGVDGDEALTACASGYHMASLFEILDPSHLEYNTDLGPTRTDSGTGPITQLGTWVRTGWDRSSTSGYAGVDNCEAWTSDDGSDYGTTAWLPNDWTGGLEDMHVWGVNRVACNSLKRVWCVEDYPSFVHLPLVLRDH